MDRRRFLRRTALGIAETLYLARGLPGAVAGGMKTDVVVLGGGVGGCAATLALLRNGFRVALTEETDWIGGQLTQQAVPPDEHSWIEQFGAPRAYRDFRRAIRDFYREHYPLAPEALHSWNFNPGNCSVSRLCHEPRVALAALEGLLAPYVSSGYLKILDLCSAVAAEVAGDRVQSIRVLDRRQGRTIELEAPYFVDATELGDLLPLTGTEYVTGAESRDQTGEPHAPNEAQPANMQAFTWCFALEYRHGEDHTIDKPSEYDFWRNYVPDLQPAWSGKLLSWTYSHPVTLEPRTRVFDPRTGAENPDLWRYRRLIDPANFEKGRYDGSISLINWPQNDYWLGNLIDVSDEEAGAHRERAMQLSYSLVYWMQTEAPRPDGGTGWPGLKMRGDLLGTAHGLAKAPYIREARRIQAEFTVLEQHVGTEARMQETGRSRQEVAAAQFHDSVGLGSYRIDLHPSSGGDNYIDISSLPFQIPMGSLIPQRIENLLPASKNLGVTHITNGCYRLHPVEWGIGEAAGLAIAYALKNSVTPRETRNQRARLEDFQNWIQNQGVEIHWPDPLRSPR